MTELLKQLRGLGLPMGTCYAPIETTVYGEDGQPTGETERTQRYITWTTDSAKADAARDAGATLRPYTSLDPRFSGWEVSCSVVLDAA